MEILEYIEQHLPSHSKKIKSNWRKLISKRFVLWTGGLCALIFGVLFWASSESIFAHDPNLVKTTRPTTSFSSTGFGLEQLFWKLHELKRTVRPNPLAYTFAGRGSSVCSVHGFLNQCMDVGGTQYFIEKKVAAGSVNFGSTNVLNGAQWIAAFEDALQNEKVEWWDSDLKGFRKENLVLLRHGRKTTLVLTAETANQYEQRHSDLKRTLRSAATLGVLPR
jgi:hypothetical protein